MVVQGNKRRYERSNDTEKCMVINMPDEPLSRSEFWQRIAVGLLGLFGVLATVITMGITFARAVSTDTTAQNQMIAAQIATLTSMIQDLRLVQERRLTQLEERQNTNITGMRNLQQEQTEQNNRINTIERKSQK